MYDDRFITDEPGKVHRVVDFAAVADFFDPYCDWDNESELKRPRPDFLTGPKDLHVLEKARSRAGLDDCESIPTDVFLLAAGEPQNPAATKFGGRPFWPKDCPWPENRAGEPHRFLCQINFTDSRDVLDRNGVPEDVLCVTCPDAEWDWDLGFHWIASDVEPDCELDVPLFNKGKYSELIGCWHGVRHRTIDYDDPIASDRAYEANAGYMLPAAAATKIGGMPFFAQGGPGIYEGFIGQIASFSICGPTVGFPDEAFEIINVPTLRDTLFERYHGVSFNDMGTFNLFLKPGGKIDFYMDSF